MNLSMLGIWGEPVAVHVCHLVMLGRYLGNCDIMGEDVLYSPQGSVGVNGVDVGVLTSRVREEGGIKAGCKKVMETLEGIANGQALQIMGTVALLCGGKS